MVIDRTGPSISSLLVSPATTSGGASVAVSALASDGLAIADASVQLGGAAWEPLAASDGAFDETSESLSGTITAPSAGGAYQVCVRAVDAAGNVGTPACTTLTVSVAGNETLSVVRSGTGTGTVSSSPSGISCGATCTASFPSGTEVTLTATPASGSTFAGWSGGVCTGTGTCSVTITAATAVTATFTASGVATVVAYTGATSAGANDAITLSAVLRTAGGKALSARSITFTLDGATYVALTDRKGNATVAATAPVAVGAYVVGVTFAGDTGNAPSTTSASLLVKPATTLTYTGGSTASKGASVVLSASLTSASAARLPGRTVTFTLGRKSYTAVTDAAGTASVVASAPVKIGTYTVGISFAGDATYAATAGGGTLQVQ